MRILSKRGDFTARELCLHARTEEVWPTLTDVKRLVGRLVRVGYLVATVKGRAHTAGRYRLIRNTGPKPPSILNATHLYDHNLRRVVAKSGRPPMREVLPALTRARAAWGNPLPDWIEALAKACDQSSQARVAGAIHYSPATLSYVLKNRYAGDARKDAERAARGASLHKMVQCPVVGPLGADACLAHQRAP